MDPDKPLNADPRVLQLRSVIDGLCRNGSGSAMTQGPGPDFCTVTITTKEGDALRRWVTKEGATRTIEIDLACGFSALHICEGLLLNGDSNARHVAMDPFQERSYANLGLQILEKAGVGPLIEFHPERSQLVLPEFLKSDRQFDLGFVDGNHRFDSVFVDLYYLGHLVRKGGVIILDDYALPGIERAASFFMRNLGWRLEETAAPEDGHHWAVLRTANEEDSRDFRYFVDF